MVSILSRLRESPRGWTGDDTSEPANQQVLELHKSRFANTNADPGHQAVPPSPPMLPRFTSFNTALPEKGPT